MTKHPNDHLQPISDDASTEEIIHAMVHRYFPTLPNTSKSCAQALYEALQRRGLVTK